MSIGILAFGAYVPRLRLSRWAIVAANAWFTHADAAAATGERAMANWDEDTVTMAEEAARDCLCGGAPGPAAVHLASTTLPFDDRQNAGIVAAALNLGEAVATLDVAGSQRAGSTGLVHAVAASATVGPVLLVASEHRRAKAGSPQELRFGDGAAAFLLGEGDPVARLVAHLSESVDFLDHYRGEGEAFDYAWEERWVRDEGYLKIIPRVVERLLTRQEIAPGEIAHVCFPGPANVVAALGKRCGFPASAVRDNLAAVCSDTGAAHPLLMLAHALEHAAPGDRILTIGFGQGCDALLFEVVRSAPAGHRGVDGWIDRRAPETSYGKFLAFNGLLPLDRGMRAELDKATALSALYRNRKTVLGLVGGRCRHCGTLQFPKYNLCVNPNCHAVRSQDDHCFSAMTGAVVSFTADLQTYTPDPPQHFGMIGFSEGGRILMDFTDVETGKIEVGQPMRMTFRIKDVDPQRGFVRYFWKAAPAAAQ